MDLAPANLIAAYCHGIFPMSAGRAEPVQWFTADPRAILPLATTGPQRFRVPRSLQRRVNSGRFRITFDVCFEQVIRACAQPRPYADDTWISEPIIAAYTELHRLGFAHSVEAWLPNDHPDHGNPDHALVGGLYGVALGGAFFGESMFSRTSDASKVCLVRLVEHLRRRGFVLLDTQYHNPHLEQFGLLEIPADDYLRRLHAALDLPVTWGD
jgi:leucyl/phenylalanyl-tRNA--protein transferase